MELPKHVCFKGDNGLYLSARVIQGYNYLQFSSNDIGDPTVRHTVHTNRDGTIRIKSDHFGKFWRRSPNWIWADSDDTAGDNPDTVFRAVRFGDMFALQNLGNNYYCTRLTTERKVSCLNASVPSINMWAHLRLEEAVLSRRIYSIEYRVMDAKVHTQKVQTMATETAVNRTGTASAAKLTLKYSVAKRRTWDSSVSLKLGVKTTIQAGVPEVASSSVEIRHEFSASYTWGESVSEMEEQSVQYDLPVPAYTKVTLRMMGRQGSCDVPFSYYQEDILTDGQKVVNKFDDGIYHGVNSYDFTSEVTEEKLPGSTPADSTCSFL
ncbi:unnamed protein product [Urochloa decumbens]|uniref:Agglutinin domain-containing protein n=1 Tax=Urochloa decumbens TaxID=240449 RepID=A0ABC8VTS3_9POAL